MVPASPPEQPTTSASSSSPDNDSTTRPSIHAQRQADYIRFKYGAALTFLVASPILIALPPRKLDPFTILLSGAFCVSANHLTREHTGRSIVDRLEAQIARSRPPSIMRRLPSERAEEVQRQLRAAMEKQQQQGCATVAETQEGRQHGAQGGQGQGRAQAKSGKRLVERIWMGGETDGWKERRLQEEQRALDEGKGYGDLIKQHIWDAWTGGKSGQTRDQSQGSNSESAG